MVFPSVKIFARLAMWIWLLFPITIFAQGKLTVEKAIEMGQRHSHAIKRAEEKLRSLGFDKKTAGSFRYPTFSADMNAFYTDAVSNLPITLPGQTFDIGSKENYQLNFKLSLPVFTGGRIANNINFVQAVYESQEFLSKAEKISVAYQVRKAFLNCLLTQTLNKSAEISRERIEIIRKNIDNLYRQGLADSLAILDAELANQEIIELQRRQKTAHDNSREVLATLTGWPVNIHETFYDSLLPPPPELFTNLLHYLEGDRMEIRALNQNMISFDYLTRVKQAEYWPTLAVYAGYSYGLPNKEFVNPEWNDNIVIGANLNWSLNLGGGLSHNINSLMAQKREIEYARKDLDDKLGLQENTARHNLKQAYDNLEITDRRFDIVSAKYRLAEEKHKHGHLSVNQLLDYEKEYTAAEQAYRAAVINYFLAETEYFYAAGPDELFGGF